METLTGKKIDENSFYKIIEKEILENTKIPVSVLDNKTDIYNDIARIMTDKLRQNNQEGKTTSFILPVGPTGQYKRFARICNEEKISCKNLITINMDEYLDKNKKYIPMDSPLSFRGFMKRNLFDLLDSNIKVKSQNIYFPDPENPSAILDLINELGKVDICFGGVGINGHVAFNEAIERNEISINEFKKLGTRIIKLSRDTIVINSIKYGGHTEFIPSYAVTIGMKEIFKSECLRFYMEHNWQSAVLRKAIYMEPSPSFPASCLKEHKNSIFIINKNVLKIYIIKQLKRHSIKRKKTF